MQIGSVSVPAGQILAVSGVIFATSLALSELTPYPLLSGRDGMHGAAPASSSAASSSASSEPCEAGSGVSPSSSSSSRSSSLSSVDAPCVAVTGEPEGDPIPVVHPDPPRHSSSSSSARNAGTGVRILQYRGDTLLSTTEKDGRGGMRVTGTAEGQNTQTIIVNDEMYVDVRGTWAKMPSAGAMGSINQLDSDMRTRMGLPEREDAAPSDTTYDRVLISDDADCQGKTCTQYRETYGSGEDSIQLDFFYLPGDDKQVMMRDPAEGIVWYYDWNAKIDPIEAPDVGFDMDAMGQDFTEGIRDEMLEE